MNASSNPLGKQGKRIRDVMGEYTTYCYGEATINCWVYKFLVRAKTRENVNDQEKV